MIIIHFLRKSQSKTRTLLFTSFRCISVRNFQGKYDCQH